MVLLRTEFAGVLTTGQPRLDDSRNKGGRAPLKFTHVD